MLSNLSNSIVLISSRNQLKSSSFGTGFIFHQDRASSYILTCLHVLETVGALTNGVYANGVPASIVCTGKKQGIDLAVLEVVGWSEKKPLKLFPNSDENKGFLLAGFYSFSSKAMPLLRQLRGNVGQKVHFISGDHKEFISAWELTIEGEHKLEPGYSGSPVIGEEHGQVIGIISYRIGSGSEGIAIAVDALEKIWTDLPPRLIASFTKGNNVNTKRNNMNTSLPPYVSNQIERIKEDIELNDSQISELKTSIRLVSEEINENIDNLVRVNVLKRRRQRYENEKNDYVQKNDSLFRKVESLKKNVP